MPDEFDDDEYSYHPRIEPEVIVIEPGEGSQDAEEIARLRGARRYVVRMRGDEAPDD
jgi:hypothetical protein